MKFTVLFGEYNEEKKVREKYEHDDTLAKFGRK
jgi:hypothetical protein